MLLNAQSHRNEFLLLHESIHFWESTQVNYSFKRQFKVWLKPKIIHTIWVWSVRFLQSWHAVNKSLCWWSRPWRHVQFARPFDDDDSVWIMSDWCLSSTNSIHWHWLRYVHDTYTVNIQRYIEIYSICIYIDIVVDTYIKVSTVYNEYSGAWIVMFTMVR